MSDTFREMLERCCDWAWNAGREGKRADKTRKNIADMIIRDHPCEVAAHKLLRVCMLLLHRIETGAIIYPQDLAEAKNAIAEANPEPNTLSEAENALLEIYMLGTNPVSEQGCTYDVDFICLINKMRQVAKKVIEKSEEVS